MSIGITEIAIAAAGIALALWLLPKALPKVARAIRQFQEELRGEKSVGSDRTETE